MLCNGISCAQLAPREPFVPQPPAGILPGVWQGDTAAGTEFATFTAEGRVIFKRARETLDMRYTIDVSTVPWKLNMTQRSGGRSVTIYTVFDFPDADCLHLAEAQPEEARRPGAAELRASTLFLQRIRPGNHTGPRDAIRASLERLSATWECGEGQVPVTLTLTPGGHYEMKTAGVTDRGSFWLSLDQASCRIHFLSSEGNGFSTVACDDSPQGLLRIVWLDPKDAVNAPDFSTPAARTFRKKEPAAALP